MKEAKRKKRSLSAKPSRALHRIRHAAYSVLAGQNPRAVTYRARIAEVRLRGALSPFADQAGRALHGRPATVAELRIRHARAACTVIHTVRASTARR